MLSTIKPNYDTMIARQDILRKIRAPVIDIPKFDAYGKVQDKTSKVMLKKKFDIIDKKASNFEFMSYNKGAVQIEFEIDPAEIIQQNRERKGVL